MGTLGSAEVGKEGVSGRRGQGDGCYCGRVCFAGEEGKKGLSPALQALLAPPSCPYGSTSGCASNAPNAFSTHSNHPTTMNLLATTSPPRAALRLVGACVGCGAGGVRAHVRAGHHLPRQPPGQLVLPPQDRRVRHRGEPQNRLMRLRPWVALGAGSAVL